MTVENGRGYRPAAEGHTDDLEVGAIPIDAIYSPVIRVEYRVENTRVGQRTNYDKLVLRIWTTGTLGPEMSLVEAAKILRKHLNPFVQYYEPGPGLPSDASGQDGSRAEPVDAELERKLDMSLAELELSVRATNCLESEGITTVRHLVSRSEDQLSTVRNFGETTLKEVRAKLHEIGLDLGMEISSRQGGLRTRHALLRARFEGSGPSLRVGGAGPPPSKAARRVGLLLTPTTNQT